MKAVISRHSFDFDDWSTNNKAEVKNRKQINWKGKVQLVFIFSDKKKNNFVICFPIFFLFWSECFHPTWRPTKMRNEMMNWEIEMTTSNQIDTTN